ncbi:MAG: hypothetical protein R3B09_27815 [Nannocystaceae bacterium]
MNLRLRGVGRTGDGRLVVGGFFPLVNSEGIALEEVLEALRQRGHVPDWSGFVRECIDFGWGPGMIVSRIEAAVGDVHGPVVRDEVSARLRRVLGEA